MIVFNKCCYYVPLRTGCFILGYLQLVTAVLGLVMSIGMMVMGVGFIDSSKKKEADAAGFIIGISAGAIVHLLCGLAFTIVLLVGLHKSKPKLIKLFMIYSVVSFVMYFITAILQVIVWEISAGIVVKKIFVLVLSAYFLLVIRSYYLKLIDEQGGEGSLRNAKS